MNNNKVCIYAISKNESKFVDQWYKSMKEADCIVVLDTGSTDDTVEKLRQHPDIIVVEKEIKPWRFDVARNEAIKYIPEDCNILFSTDLDEVLESGWADILRSQWIDGVHERAYYSYAWSHLSNGEPGRVFQYDKIHSRNWIWKYPVHELLYNPTTKTNLYTENEVLNLFNRIYLHHYPDQTKSRGSYLGLLELRAQEDEDDYYGLIYLAHEYYYRGYYEKSIETLYKVLEYHIDKCTRTEEASCYLFAGDAYSAMEKYTEAIKEYKKAINVDPTYREPYLNLAKVYMSIYDYKSAIEIVNTGLINSYRHYTWLERDLSWTYEPYDLLSLSYYYNGNIDKSLYYAIKAYMIDKSEKRLEDNVNIIMKTIEDRVK